MSVRKDSRSPYWQFDFQRDKKRFYGSTGCTTRRDAEKYEAELKRKVALGEETRPAITLGEAVTLYWDKKARHEKNFYTTEYQLANLIRLIGKNRNLALIRHADLTAFVAKRRGEHARARKVPVSNATVNRELQLAQRMWKYVRGEGYDVPAPDDKLAIKWGVLKLREPKERVRELSVAEERRLIESLNLDADLLDLVEFAHLSGQRKNALITLDWRRVNFEELRAGVITKGSVEHWFPLTPRMAELLLARPKVDGCPYVFTYKCKRPSPKRADRPARHKGQRYPFSQGGWARHWQRALANAGIADFRFHDLRHTSATRVVRTSGNLKAAQKLLGHSDIATTARYAHVMDDDLRTIMSATESRNSHGEQLRGGAASATKTAKNDGVE